jgi:SAM-dependent methyltransferase
VSAAVRRRGRPLFTAMYAVTCPALEKGLIGQVRRELVTTARGVVIDLGAGTGANLPHLGSAVTEIHAVEPDPHMARRLRPRLPGKATLHAATAEALPLDDASADTVLATLTLCSVQDLDAAAREIRRVLRPGGLLLVLEHVRADNPRRAAWQRRLRGAWGCFGGGCDPGRDTTTHLTRAGFDTMGLRRFELPGEPVTRDWVMGSEAPDRVMSPRLTTVAPWWRGRLAVRARQGSPSAC